MNKKMTEKIKELSDAAEWYTEADPLKKNPIFDRQKFAELIVRECAGVAFDEYAATNGAASGESAILKHFGVEYKHIVRVHPVENGLPNLHKVKDEKEFETEYDAKVFVMDYNLIYKKTQAVYVSRVNCETGELE
jgi:hypothetical protein